MSVQSEQYIPHRSKMNLIDQVLKVNDEYALCEVNITPQSTFYESIIEGVYNWIAVEYMAQSIAAYAGFHSKSVNIGLLLSVRKFSCSISYFPKGSILTIKVKKIYLEDNLGVFDCEISLVKQLVASAKLNTFQPPKDKITAILKGEMIA